MGWRRFKITVSLWWNDWKITHFKKLYECDLDELVRKRDFHKYMSYTYMTYVIVSLGMIVEMYFKEQGDIVINTMLILVMLALYDSKNEMNYINKHIYTVKKENGIL